LTKKWQYRKNRQKVNAKTERGKDARKNPLLLSVFALFFSEFCGIVKNGVYRWSHLPLAPTPGV
jgi:hypothetical protein